MRYAQWTFAEVDGVKTTPLLASGIAFLDDAETQIIGYLDETADVDQMNQWSVEELTQNQALALLVVKVPSVTVNPDGVLVFPYNEVTVNGKN